MDDPRHLDPNREWSPVINHKGEIVTYEPVLTEIEMEQTRMFREPLHPNGTRLSKLKSAQILELIPRTSPHQSTDQGEE